MPMQQEDAEKNPSSVVKQDPVREMYDRPYVGTRTVEME
jgi:hypothetical protein